MKLGELLYRLNHLDEFSKEDVDIVIKEASKKLFDNQTKVAKLNKELSRYKIIGKVLRWEVKK